MNHTIKRGLALLMVLVMCISFLPALHINTSAASVEYKYSGNYIYNWGQRGTTATFLSPNAEKFYAENVSYDALAANAGGTNVSTAPTSALYSALQAIMVSNHDYETDYDITRGLYQYTDCQNNGGKISSFYSGNEIGPAWDGGSTWNREHTWPNSKGLGGNDENDIMMLRPTAKSENGARGNKSYGQSSGYYNPNSESGGKYDLRGDVARIFLYVYVRWGNVNGNGSYTAWGTRGVMESVDVLLAWMEADPVDTWELGRNDSVESITGTRNVFVDYPEFAFLLFGEEIPENMTTPSSESRKDCGHNNYDAGVVTKPTCTASGYTLYTCQTANCGHAKKINIVAAVGHSFTAGVCAVCGTAEPVAPKEPTYVTTVKTSTPYKLGFYSTSNNTVYYFTGAMSGYYGATDTSYEKGVDVYAEQVSGGYRLYFNNGSQKQYINLVQNNTFYNFTFSTTATSVFTWDAEKHSFYTTVGSEICYMGTYGSYTTVATITSSKIKDTDYFAHLYTVEEATPDDKPCEHNYQNNVCINCGDVKVCNHAYQNGVCISCGDTKPASSGKANISFADKANRTEFSTSIQVWQQNGITVTNNKASASSNVADYAKPARFYQGSSVTIAYPNMTKIEINCSGLESKYVDPWKAVPAGATATVSNNVVTITFSSPVDSLVYSSLAKQARAYDITVYAEMPNCAHSNTVVEDKSEATCANAGYTGNTVCIDCRELISAGTSIPQADHEYGEWEISTIPTCTAEGATRRNCKNCDHYEAEVLPKIDHIDLDNDGACDVCEILSENNGTDTQDSINAIISSCSGVIGGSSMTIIALIGAIAVMFAKKKED